MVKILRLDKVAASRRAVHARYSIGDLMFQTSIWYGVVDFDELRREFGRAAVERLLFHVAAFDINKIASLKPDYIDWGDYAHLADERFNKLWRVIFENVWAEWRFRNDEPQWRYPKFANPPAPERAPRIERTLTDEKILAFCGGGKDSLMSLHLLQELKASYDTLVYSASFYGTSDAQHDSIDKLIDFFHPAARRRLWIQDDFLDLPLLKLRPDLGVASVTAAETPSSIFAALPIALQHGRRYVCLAHERSADAGQAFWRETGEIVNHQWGKSLQAETLLNAYIQETLVGDFDYFSMIKPIYDVPIFNYLRRFDREIPATHSCNIKKPWCRRCPKCLYVWLGYAAFLPDRLVAETFGSENLLDVEDNVETFRKLAGLEDQLPFECIGEADEAVLYLAMCQARGRRGAALDACRPAIDTLDVAATLDKYLSVDMGSSLIPEGLQAPLQAIFAANAQDARAFIEGVLAREHAAQ